MMETPERAAIKQFRPLQNLLAKITTVQKLCIDRALISEFSSALDASPKVTVSVPLIMMCLSGVAAFFLNSNFYAFLQELLKRDLLIIKL